MTAPHIQAAQKVFFTALWALPKEERGEAAAAAPWVKNNPALEALDAFQVDQPGYSAEVYWIWVREKSDGDGEAWADAPLATQFAWCLALDTMKLFRPAPDAPPVEIAPPIEAKRIGTKRNGRIGRRVKGLEPPVEAAPEA